MGSVRLENWPRLLAELLAEDAVFRWGESDCGLWACTAFERLTGTHPEPWFQGRYTTEAGAAKALRKYAGTLEDCAAAVMAKNGRGEIPPMSAQRGDWVMFRGSLGDTLGVCVGQYIASPTDAGIGYTPMSAAYRAWRV